MLFPRSFVDTQCSFGSTVKSQEAKDRETVYVAGVGGGGSHTCFEVLLFSAEACPSFSISVCVFTFAEGFCVRAKSAGQRRVQRH